MLRRLALAALAACAVPLAAMAQVGPPQGNYIVVLKDGPELPEGVAADVEARTNGRVSYVYGTAIRGFAISMPRAAVAGLARDPRVAYIEDDLPVSIFAQTKPTGVSRIFSKPDVGDGVDERVDVDVAILDTGIDIDHPDLNVVEDVNCLSYTGRRFWERIYNCVPGGDDDHYHGTHVAGTVGALDNGIGVVGVAPGARLWAVKVLDSGGSGSFGGIIAGIDWVAAQGNIEVINMSLGGSGTSSAMNSAIANAVVNGVTVVVAAGNSAADAANFTPANAPDAIAVSALADFNGLPGGGANPTCRTDVDDTLADFSNYGTTVEIAAPGVCILSTYPLEQGGYGTISGTSMASPHVAGAAALLASIPGTTPAQIRAQLLADGNYNWVDDADDGSHEPLLDVSGFAYKTTGGGGGPVNTAPVAGNDTYSTPYQTQLNVDSPGVLGNDTDANSDPLTASLKTGPSHGVLTLNANGSFNYAPAAGYSGGDSFTYVANDGIADSNTATVSITVGPAPGGITLSVNAYKVKGVQTADLTWSGATTLVDIWRDGAVVLSNTANDGNETNSTGLKGGGSATYKVCPTGSTDSCSNQVTAVW